MFDFLFKKKQPKPKKVPVAADFPLFFKDNVGAFEVACKLMDCSLFEGARLPALVLDATGMFGFPTAVKKRENGRQRAILRIASSEGVFIVPADTVGANGPDLAPGDLVEWWAGKFSDEVARGYGNRDFGWVGLITAKLKPAIIDGVWQIESSFKP